MLFLLRISLFIVAIITSENCFAENEYAKKFISNYGYDKAIAQLFVTGVPADYKNKDGNPDIKEIFFDIGVGGVMLNNYNVPDKALRMDDDRELSINSVREFINNIRSRSVKSSDFPVSVYVDFESNEFSSVKYPLLPPPNPLVLASSGNTKYAYIAGRTAAYQLKGIGVDAIFGPVFDLDHCSQGFPNHSISLRVFSESRKIMTPYVRAYLKGISEAGIYTFAKHFPSYSHVYKNAHKTSTVYAASEGNIKRDILSFEELHQEYDGIMSSHLIVKAIDEKTPVTYNGRFITDFIKSKNELKYKLLVTDDLSNMEAAKQYIKDRYGVFSYKHAALNAFKAGHDLLLFSHITGSSGKEHSAFKINDLRESISEIKEAISSDDKYKEQFLFSLNKVLEYKLKVKETIRPPSADINAKMFWPDDAMGFSSYHDYLNKLFDSSVIHLSNGKGKSLDELVEMDNKFLYASSDSMELYSKLLGTEFSFKFESVGKISNDKDFNLEKKRFQELVGRSDLVIMVVENVDHANILDSIRLKSPRLLERIVVFLHGSPHLINEQLINSVNVYGNFSKDSESYKSDVKIIRGDISPRALDYLPVSLGNGSIHNVINTVEPIESDIGINKLLIFNTDEERRLYDEGVRKDNEINKLNVELSAVKKSFDVYKNITLNWRVVVIPALMNAFNIILLLSIVFGAGVLAPIANRFGMLAKFSFVIIPVCFFLYLTFYFYSKIYPGIEWLSDFAEFFRGKL
ncbi:MAG: glycoside hydrolase family 3 N-terminal domain-containing protein [Turicibacter sp.]